MLIELAKAGDLAAIAALLREAGLPNADLDAGKLEHFLVLRGADSTTVSGAVGFEPHGSAALLRSLVVLFPLLFALGAMAFVTLSPEWSRLAPAEQV